MNSVSIVGRLTKDPELKFTQSGKAVCSFTLAVKRPFAKKEDKDQADFIPCIIWGKTAENTGKYTQKGSLVAISGRIQTRNYEAQDGTKRYVTEVIADEIHFLGGKPSAQNNTMDPDLHEVDISEDELPF